MVHTKMMINDEYISFGSTNINKKAFNQLSELNIFIKNKNSLLVDLIMDSVVKNYKEAIKINDYKEIKYNKVVSAIESILV
jgi:phosphatidylserine/phosphatidylglycerophosphate/cardiolipin synthase-like enzyme